MARAGAEEYWPPITPFGGWVSDERTNRLRPLETAPHIGAFAPPGTGKTRKWLAQSAVLWPGPALVSSSKDDLMQMMASRRYGPSALLDLRSVAAPYYPSDFTAHRFDPTALIATVADAMAWPRQCCLPRRWRCRHRISRRIRPGPLGSTSVRAIDVPAVRGQPCGDGPRDGVDVGGVGKRRDAQGDERVSARRRPVVGGRGGLDRRHAV